MIHTIGQSNCRQTDTGSLGLAKGLEVLVFSFEFVSCLCPSGRT